MLSANETREREWGSSLNPSPQPSPKGRGSSRDSHRFSSKLSEQRFEVLNHYLVRGAVGGHDAVAIVYAHSVVTQRLAEQIGQASAGLCQNCFGPAGVPLLCAGRKMQVKVRLLFGDQ